MKREKIINKLNNVFGDNYSCEYVKENIKFKKKCHYVKFPNYCLNVGIIILVCTVCLLALSSSFLAVGLDRKAQSLNKHNEVENGLVDYKDYYQELNSDPILSFEYKKGYSFSVFEANEKTTGERIYFYKLEVADEDRQNENQLIVYVNDAPVLINDSVVFGYIGKAKNIFIVIKVDNNTKYYNYDL